MPSSRAARMGRAFATMVCLFGVAVVSACTSSEPQPTPTLVSPSPSASTAPSPTPESPSPDVEAEPTAIPVAAVVSLASLDVNGEVLTVAGYVQGIAEADGMCTFSVVSAAGDEVLAAEGLGVENVNTTSCGSHDLSAEPLARGSWTVVLAYRSTDGTDVVSNPYPLEVP